MPGDDPELREVAEMVKHVISHEDRAWVYSVTLAELERGGDFRDVAKRISSRLLGVSSPFLEIIIRVANASAQRGGMAWRAMMHEFLKDELEKHEKRPIEHDAMMARAGMIDYAKTMLLILEEQERLEQRRGEHYTAATLRELRGRVIERIRSLESM